MNPYPLDVGEPYALTIDGIFLHVVSFLSIVELSKGVAPLSKRHNKLLFQGEYSFSPMIKIASYDFGQFAMKWIQVLLAKRKEEKGEKLGCWANGDPIQATGFYVVRELYLTLDHWRSYWYLIVDLIRSYDDANSARGIMHDGFADVCRGARWRTYRFDNERSALPT